MEEIEVVYSPVCEATGAMIGMLKGWLDGLDIQIRIFPFDRCPQRLRNEYTKGENCFIDVFYRGNRIDSVPLHRDKIYAALSIRQPFEPVKNENVLLSATVTGEELTGAFQSGALRFYPIDAQNYMEEMSMCLCNYPFGNPPKEFHGDCLAIKSRVFSEVWKVEDVAGIYAKYRGKVVGLLEVMPREILQKYGYMTGRAGKDRAYLSVGCFEVGYGIARVEMIDLLMGQLQTIFPLFHRRQIEGVGIYGWMDGFNPYWVYKKYGFIETEKLSENTAVLSKRMDG